MDKDLAFKWLFKGLAYLCVGAIFYQIFCMGGI